MAEYVNLKQFNDETEIEDLIRSFKDNDIDYKIQNVTPQVDIALGGSQRLYSSWLQVSSEDLDKANQLVEDIPDVSKFNKDMIDDDHYFYQFSNEELEDVLLKYDEWNTTDYAFAQLILKERGIVYTQEDLEKKKEKRLNQLSTPENGELLWIIIGFILAIGGGIIGILIGWHYKNLKKTLPDGKRIYYYDEKTRQIGSYMYILGIISFIFWIIWRFAFYN